MESQLGCRCQVSPLLRAIASSSWVVSAARLVGNAPPGSDWFADPAGEVPPARSGPTLLARPGDRDFRLSAKVVPQFTATFDAGVLFVWADSDRFAKLCFELTPQAQPMIVSVVSRGVSDDANAMTVEDDGVYLRVSRTGPVYAFHSSKDQRHWSMVRLFTLGGDIESHRVGFEVQAPTGEGCAARFQDVSLTFDPLVDPRDGS